MDNKKVYYLNLEPKLTKRGQPPQTVAIPLDGITPYTALALVNPQSLVLHSYKMTPDINKLLAFCTGTGTTIQLIVESIYLDELIEPLRQVDKPYYKLLDKKPIYAYINEILAPYESTMLFIQDEIYARRNSNEQPNFIVTDEIENFIKVYAPAYGIQVPRFKRAETTAQTYTPYHWASDFNKLKRQTNNLDKTLAKWDIKSSHRNDPDQLKDIKAIYESLKYYLENGIEYDEYYTNCTDCNKPYRTNQSLTIDGINAYFSQCPTCGKMYQSIGYDTQTIAEYLL